MHASPLLRSFRAIAVAMAAVSGLAVVPAHAQPSANGVISGSFDRVARPTATTDEASAAPAGTFDFEHFAFDDRLRLFYSLDGGTFSDPGDWHYLAQYGGARHAFDLPAGLRLSTGGTATVRVNGDSWSSANYNGVGAFANVERTRDTSTLRAGVRVDARRFADEAALDQNEFSAFASARRSFQTRTTLIGEVSWGAKHFTNGSLVTVSPVPVEPAAGDSGSTMVGGAGNGHGNAGNANGPGTGTSTTSGTRAGGQFGAWHLSAATSSTSSDAPARQVTVFGRVAQSLADRLAISFEASRRNAGGVVAPAVVDTPEMLIDDGVYDDPYASDATTWRAGVKYAGGDSRGFDAGVSHWNKFYEATPALDASGTPVPGVRRDDRVWRVDVSWREPIAPARSSLVSLAFVASYSFMSSTSTDAYYNYDAHRVRFGLAVSY